MHASPSVYEGHQVKSSPSPVFFDFAISIELSEGHALDQQFVAGRLHRKGHNALVLADDFQFAADLGLRCMLETAAVASC